MKLEICASSYQSAINAQKAGAHRIELCAELAIGGITPSYGLLKQTLTDVTIPVFVLIRPRSGNFTYSDAEFNIMKKDIKLCKDSGCAGIVSGILNMDNTIDVGRTQELIALSKPLPFSFHRAFDWTPNPTKALDQLISLGVNRVLTSGQETSAKKGIALLKQLNKIANGRITILPGGGINAKNAAQFKAAGFTEIHASATTVQEIGKTPKVKMNSDKFFNETMEVYSDETKITNVLNAISKSD